MYFFKYVKLDIYDVFNLIFNTILLSQIEESKINLNIIFVSA